MKNTFILASSSKYRQKILKTLINDFQSISPNINETPLKNESAKALVKRLAYTKAKAIRVKSKNTIVIASDQCAIHNGNIIGKPANKNSAIEQLKSFSGQSIIFLTSLCVINFQSRETIEEIDEFTVHFRVLSDQEIISYIDKEMPLDCAGSFKSEGLGISLFNKLEGEDFNALIGLPIIKLNKILIKMGINALTD